MKWDFFAADTSFFLAQFTCPDVKWDLDGKTGKISIFDLTHEVTGELSLLRYDKR